MAYKKATSPSAKKIDNRKSQVTRTFKYREHP